MTVAGVTVDPVTKSPIVVLRDREGGSVVPIWIGILEANAIAVALGGMEMPRPMTHDLMKSILDATGSRLLSVEISEIRDNTYFALLHIQGIGGTLRIDARPSDAIAIALRCGAPILVSETVLAQSSIPASLGTEGGERDKWSELLEKMDPEQFSKYKM
ncbi:MAG TPA: bifunctional nuclease family protein [Candidatus Methylomirabilis sp.]|nr:bifunctional nuclease family protein [Candidatus Methylomirabilis sp.]